MDKAQRYHDIKTRLESHGQAHLLAFYDELSEKERENLLSELETQDWERLAELVHSHVLQKPEAELPSRIEAAPFYPAVPGEELRAKYAEACTLGEELIREGKVAAFTVAGGQGTRLGWDGPKGTFPATPILGKPLFRVFAEFLRKVGEKYGKTPPWYVMTSPGNDAATRAFFEEHGFFGLVAKEVTFFPQGTMPSITLDGKVLLVSKSSLALSPDGHGGSLRALATSGALDDMGARGIEHISYFQVDNPNVKCLDPLFLGLHALDGAEMSSKGLPKTGPGEKVGNFCLMDGRVGVIEYSDMPTELAEAKDERGGLKFNLGSIAIHALSVGFVRRLSQSGRFALPYHRADKKVSYIDEEGREVKPEAPNAVKLELFVFDALPLAEKSIILETERVEEFAPIKNASGADSPASSKSLQSLRAGRWLAKAGVAVPFGDGGELQAVLELSHLTAISAEDLEGQDLPGRIEPGSELVL